MSLTTGDIAMTAIAVVLFLAVISFQLGAILSELKKLNRR